MLIDRNSGYTEARPDTILSNEKIITDGGKQTTEKAEPGEKKLHANRKPVERIGGERAIRGEETNIRYPI